MPPKQPIPNPNPMPANRTKQTSINSQSSRLAGPKRRYFVSFFDSLKICSYAIRAVAWPYAILFTAKCNESFGTRFMSIHGSRIFEWSKNSYYAPHLHLLCAHLDFFFFLPLLLLLLLFLLLHMLGFLCSRWTHPRLKENYYVSFHTFHSILN